MKYLLLLVIPSYLGFIRMQCSEYCIVWTKTVIESWWVAFVHYGALHSNAKKKEQGKKVVLSSKVV